jgi:hypothetical protein
LGQSGAKALDLGEELFLVDHAFAQKTIAVLYKLLDFVDDA